MKFQILFTMLILTMCTYSHPALAEEESEIGQKMIDTVTMHCQTKLMPNMQKQFTTLRATDTTTVCGCLKDTLSRTIDPLKMYITSTFITLTSETFKQCFGSTLKNNYKAECLSNVQAFNELQQKYSLNLSQKQHTQYCTCLANENVKVSTKIPTKEDQPETTNNATPEETCLRNIQNTPPQKPTRRRK